MTRHAWPQRSTSRSEVVRWCGQKRAGIHARTQSLAVAESKTFAMSERPSAAHIFALRLTLLWRWNGVREYGRKLRWPPQHVDSGLAARSLLWPRLCRLHRLRYLDLVARQCFTRRNTSSTGQSPKPCFCKQSTLSHESWGSHMSQRKCGRKQFDCEATANG